MSFNKLIYKDLIMAKFRANLIKDEKQINI